MANEKKYGLVMPKKQQLFAPKAGNIFGDSDDSDQEDGAKQVKKALKAEHEKTKVKKQTLIDMQKALKEDPTIFQYDEVYDEIERSKEEEKTAVKVEKKPKYIYNLLKSADLRKKEQELRKDRMIQKEIEAEDNMFPDKERFVTSSYKAKLEEMKKFEEEQEHKNRLEAMCDVTKQNDMTGFYRHLYRQTVEKKDSDTGNVSEENKKEEKDTSKEQKEVNTKLPADIDKDDPIPSDSDSEEDVKSDSENEKKSSKISTIKKTKNKRQYRKRDTSESESEEEPVKEEKKIDAMDTSESNDDDSDALESSPLEKQKMMVKENYEKENGEKMTSINDAEKEAEKSEIGAEKKNIDTTKENNKSEEKETQVKVEKPKPVKKKKNLDIWEKRTVGSAFEAALQRYLKRQAERLAGSQ